MTPSTFALPWYWLPSPISRKRSICHPSMSCSRVPEQKRERASRTTLPHPPGWSFGSRLALAARFQVAELLAAD